MAPYSCADAADDRAICGRLPRSLRALRERRQGDLSGTALFGRFRRVARAVAQAYAPPGALQLPLTRSDWHSIWLSDAEADRDWLRAYRLNSGLYDRQIKVRRTV